MNKIITLRIIDFRNCTVPTVCYFFRISVWRSHSYIGRDAHHINWVFWWYCATTQGWLIAICVTHQYSIWVGDTSLLSRGHINWSDNFNIVVRRKDTFEIFLKYVFVRGFCNSWRSTVSLKILFRAMISQK